MKRASRIFTVLLPLAAIGAGAGCTSPTSPRLPTAAIAIRPVENRPPSAEEAQVVLQTLRPMLLQKGAALAERSDSADFVVTVNFTPANAGSGPRVTVIGIEPTNRFRDATSGDDTPEAREWRRRLREIEGWARNQARDP